MLAANTNNTGQSVLELVGPNIIHHVSNSSKEHPIIKIPELFGIDFSITKHVLMLWIVAIIVSFVIIFPLPISQQLVDHPLNVWKIKILNLIL